MAAAQLPQSQPPARGQLPWRMVWTAGTVAQTGASVTAKALEPLVTCGASDVEAPAELSEGLAHYEHTILITAEKPVALTALALSLI
jgi:hypothetical protein